jgi:hypothetical protein
MKTLIKLAILTLLDYFIIEFWVHTQDPDPSSSLVLILLVPFVIVLNLAIAGVLAFIKKGYAVFILNAIVSAFIMKVLFDEGISQHQNRLYESWAFIKADTTFQVTRLKESHEFSLAYSTIPGSSMEFLDGEYVFDKGSLILMTDSTKYTIRNGYIVGFRNPKDSLRVEKVIR